MYFIMLYNSQIHTKVQLIIIINKMSERCFFNYLTIPLLDIEEPVSMRGHERFIQ